MRTPDEAIAEILERARPTTTRELVPLHGSVGRVLASPVVSDLDLPPFEKSAMDGWAVRSADLAAAPGRGLRVVGEARAGETFDGRVGPGECVAIYTGAELPAGADAVVMVEKSERVTLDGIEHVRSREAPRPGQHVCHRGEDLARGETVHGAGRRVRSADLGALASAGADPLEVFARPRVVVLTTGDELVAGSALPGPGQIRESNTVVIASLARAAGAEVLSTSIVPDVRAQHVEAFAAALESADVVITSGGVSAGKYDLVGEALLEVGVTCVFHKVAVKPGKPLWFGVRGEKLVFALPGNPVSTLVTHEVFVRPALRKVGGESSWSEPMLAGRFVGEPPAPLPREQHLPVAARPCADGVTELEPVAWRGSADVVGLSRADGFVVCPANETLQRGALARWRPFGA